MAFVTRGHDRAGSTTPHGHHDRSLKGIGTNKKGRRKHTETEIQQRNKTLDAMNYHMQSGVSVKCYGELKHNADDLEATSEQLAEQYVRRASLLTERGRYCAVQRKETLSTIERARRARMNPIGFMVKHLTSARKVAAAVSIAMLCFVLIVNQCRRRFVNVDRRRACVC